VVVSGVLRLKVLSSCGVILGLVACASFWASQYLGYLETLQVIQTWDVQPKLEDVHDWANYEAWCVLVPALVLLATLGARLVTHSRVTDPGPGDGA